MTQMETVLKHLQENGGLTPMVAFRKYGITRLGGIVYFLRQDGYDIKTKIVEVKDRHGHKCRVAEYTL